MIPGRQAVSGFDPRTIPGCSIWLDAADSNTITVTSGFVSAWIDKSSNAYTFSNAATSGRTGPTRVTTQNGLDVLTFTATSATDANGQYLTNTRTLVANNRELCVFLVHKPDLLNGANYGNTNAVVLHTGATLITQIPFSDATGSVGWRGTNIASPIWNNPTTAYSIMTASVRPYADARSLSNGLDISSLYVSSAGGTPTAFSNTIGAARTTGISNFYSGTIAEVLLYTRTVSKPDQQQIEGYLARKWGISLSSNHPYATISQSNRPFLPTDIDDCIIWFDAADLRTLTLSGTTVTAWRNKGILSNVTATNTLASPLAFGPGTVSSGFTFNTSPLNTLQFPALSYLAVSNVVTTMTPRTLFFIFTVTSYGDGYGRVFSSATTTGVHQTHFNAWNRDGNAVVFFPAGLGGQAISAGGQAPYSGTLPYDATPFVIGIRHAFGNTEASRNTSQPISNAISINGRVVTLSSDVRMSAYQTGPVTFTVGTAGYSNVQRIGEVIQYDRDLTDTEMREVEGYLCWKWGVTVADASHAYVRVPPAVSTVFHPPMFPGCVLWADAADPTTLTASGSSVTAWTDKSGNGNTLSFAVSPTTGSVFQNGNNTLTFAASLGSNSNCIINAANHTLIAVHRPSTVDSNTSLFRFQTGTANPYVVFPYYSSATSRGWVTSVDGAALSNTGAGLPEGSSTSTYTMVMACIASASQEVFSNGVRVASNTQALTTSNMPFLTLGATTTGTEPYGGNVGELIVYNYKLSETQRMILEGYLAKKWNLPLPSTHPYLLPPSLSPAQNQGIVRRGLVSLFTTCNVQYTPNFLQWVDPIIGARYTLGSALLRGTTTPNGKTAIELSSAAGSETNVNATDASSYNYPTNPGFTIDVWWSTAATPTAYVHSEWTGTTTPRQSYIFMSNNRIYGGFGSGVASTPVSVSSPAFVWYHGCVTVGTSGWVFYLNGRVVGSSNALGTTRTTTSRFLLGRGYVALTGESLTSYMRYTNVKRYNVTLDASEVRQNYNALAADHGLDPISV